MLNERFVLAQMPALGVLLNQLRFAGAGRPGRDSGRFCAGAAYDAKRREVSCQTVLDNQK